MQILQSYYIIIYNIILRAAMRHFLLLVGFEKKKSLTFAHLKVIFFETETFRDIAQYR